MTRGQVMVMQRMARRRQAMNLATALKSARAQRKLEAATREAAERPIRVAAGAAAAKAVSGKPQQLTPAQKGALELLLKTAGGTDGRGPDAELELIEAALNGLGGSDGVDQAAPPLWRTALQHAAAAGNLSAASLLLQKGAAVERRDGKGRTAVMCAAAHGHAAVLRVLAGAGADVSTCDSAGRSAVGAALANACTTAAAALAGRGARLPRTSVWRALRAGLRCKVLAGTAEEAEEAAALVLAAVDEEEPPASLLHQVWRVLDCEAGGWPDQQLLGWVWLQRATLGRITPGPQTALLALPRGRLLDDARELAEAVLCAEADNEASRENMLDDNKPDISDQGAESAAVGPAGGSRPTFTGRSEGSEGEAAKVHEEGGEQGGTAQADAAAAAAVLSAKSGSLARVSQLRRGAAFLRTQARKRAEAEALKNSPPKKAKQQELPPPPPVVNTEDEQAALAAILVHAKALGAVDDEAEAMLLGNVAEGTRKASEYTAQLTVQLELTGRYSAAEERAKLERAAARRSGAMMIGLQVQVAADADVVVAAVAAAGEKVDIGHRRAAGRLGVVVGLEKGDMAKVQILAERHAMRLFPLSVLTIDDRPESADLAAPLTVKRERLSTAERDRQALLRRVFSVRPPVEAQPPPFDAHAADLNPLQL